MVQIGLFSGNTPDRVRGHPRGQLLEAFFGLLFNSA
jgi:hypothetical protein